MLSRPVTEHVITRAITGTPDDQLTHFFLTMLQLVKNIQILMSASATMEVATILAITWMEVTHALAIMATSLPLMEKHVKVSIY